MKFKVNTAMFQNMVAKAVKGAGANNDLLITQLMGIALKDNKLSLATTDNTNYLYVIQDKVTGDDFEVVVPVEKFSKLISKLTCEDLTLEVPTAKKGELDKLIIHGNGKYVVELPYDEEGELVEFPNPAEGLSTDDWDKTEVNLSTIRLILSTAKAALQVGKEDSCYKNYYVGERVVATDTYKICGIDVKLFNEPKLISPELMDLLDVMSEEKITVCSKGDKLIFVTDSVIVYGEVEEGIEDYQIDAISSLLDQGFPSECKIEKSTLVQMLERISLFVDVFDKNSVYLTFTKDGLLVSSKKDSGSELIPYKESTNFNDYTCCSDIDLLKTQVKSYQSDLISMLYGKDQIKLVCGNTKQIIALADDDRFDSEEETAEEE